MFATTLNTLGRPVKIGWSGLKLTLRPHFIAATPLPRNRFRLRVCFQVNISVQVRYPNRRFPSLRKNIAVNRPRPLSSTSFLICSFLVHTVQALHFFFLFFCRFKDRVMTHSESEGTGVPVALHFTEHCLTGWSRGNALELYSGSVRWGHRLSWLSILLHLSPSRQIREWCFD
jgi:hypothetical protein